MSDKPTQQEKARMEISTQPLAGAAAKKRGPALAHDIQVQIGRRLAAVYDDVLQQPVPDRFRQLLDALDRQTEPTGEEGDCI